MSLTLKFKDISLSEYTNQSVIVEGSTFKYKEDLKKLGGKYNNNLKNGPGWIFPKSKEAEIVSFINKGKRLVSDEEAREGEIRSKQKAKEWNEKKEVISGDDLRSDVKVPNKHENGGSEYASLLMLVNSMSKRIELLEKEVFRLRKSDSIRPLPDTTSCTSPADPVSYEDEDGEEVVVPHKRLLR